MGDGTGKARSPIVDRRVDGTVSVDVLCWPIDDGDKHQLQWSSEVFRQGTAAIEAIYGSTDSTPMRRGMKRRITDRQPLTNCNKYFVS